MAWADTQNSEDIELVKRAVDAACEHPQRFDMTYWACGSAMCIGGWMCYLSDDKAHRQQLIAIEVGRWLSGRGLLAQNWKNLFVMVDWPKEFHPGYSRVTGETNKPTVEQLRARFAHWLETGL